MENTEELNHLVEQTKLLLKNKTEELYPTISSNFSTKRKIEELERRIKALEDYTYEIELLYARQPNILLNFRKRTIEIKSEIDSLK